MAAPFVFADNARSTLGAALSLGGSTLTLASGGGALFPSPAPGQQFALTLNDLATQAIFEVVWCTARAGDVLTVLRAQEGTAARAWNVGDYVWNGPTAGQMNNLVQTPHMTDASIAPVFGSTQVQGTVNATGAAVFGSTGQFGATVTVVDTSTGSTGTGIVVQSTGGGTQGARIMLQGTPGASGTPNKTLRAQSGVFDIVNSAYSGVIISITDLGDVSSIRNLSAGGSGSFSGPLFSAQTGTFNDTTGVGGVIINSSSATAAANLRLTQTGAATPNKFIRSNGSYLEVVNSAYSGVIMRLDDAGNAYIPGGFTINGTVSSSAVTASGSVNGATVQSNNGNVTANNGRLRASFGAAGSGDPNAAVLLADFVMNPQGNDGYVWMQFPDGFIIQAYRGGTVTGADFVTFPNAFPNACIQVLAHEGAPGGWLLNGVLSPTIFGTQQLSNTSFALYCIRNTPPGTPNWTYAVGITFRYIAIGY